MAYTTASGAAASLTARAAVVTLPLGYLKRHAAALFSPPLPGPVAAAVSGLGMGTLDKVVLTFASAFWPQSWEWVDVLPPADNPTWNASCFGQAKTRRGARKPTRHAAALLPKTLRVKALVRRVDAVAG